MAAFLQQSMNRLCLQPSFIIPAWGKRSVRANGYRACMSVGPDRYECGRQTPGEKHSDSSKRYKDISWKIVSLGKRNIGKEALDPVFIQMDGISQYASSSDQKLLPNRAKTLKKPLHTTTNSEEKILSNSRSKLETHYPSMEMEIQHGVGDARRFQSLEMRRFTCSGKQDPRMKEIVSDIVEFNHCSQFSAKHSTKPYSVKQFDGIKLVPNGLEDSNHTSLTSGKFVSTQVSEDFGDEADALHVAPSSIVQHKRIANIKNTAVRALAARPLTKSQLRKKLLGKNFPSDLVEAVITELQASGMQSDYAYAEMFSQSRWSSRGWGPKRIKAALVPKGISGAHIERALQHVFLDEEDDGEEDDEDEEEMDKEKKWGMSKSAKAHLVSQATKQWLRSGNASLETRKVRMVRWLQYRGFNWDVISPILRQLQSKYPAQ